MNEKILEIIQNNYNLFKGTNEAEIHASFEIEAFFKEFLSDFGTKIRQQSFNEGIEEGRKKPELFKKASANIIDFADWYHEMRDAGELSKGRFTNDEILKMYDKTVSK